MKDLKIAQLKAEVQGFIQTLSATPIPILYGATDGKAIGTYVEQAFHKYLGELYVYILGTLQVVSISRS